MTHTGKWGFHIHHEVLVERFVAGGIEERTAYIKNKKPDAEIPTRLRLMRPACAECQPKLDAASKAYDEAMAPAWKAYNEATAPARKAYDEAMALAWKAYNEAMAPAWKAYNEAMALASKAYNEAMALASKAYDEATAPASKAYDDVISACHAHDCEADCPWNGETIFPEAK